MKRRIFLTHTALALTLCLAREARSQATSAAGAPAFPPLGTPHTDWSTVLEPERFDVLFHEETEFAGSSPLNSEKRRGTYLCAACLLPLFDSQHKYESGTGWPSFTQPLDRHIARRTDYRMIVPRTEYHCARCGGHQGHVFKDGPPPRGERWCNNGLALQFIPAGESLPALRN